MVESMMDTCLAVSSMNLSPISLIDDDSKDLACNGGIICDLLKSCDSPPHDPFSSRDEQYSMNHFPDSPDSLPLPKKRKRIISEELTDDESDDRRPKCPRNVERDAPLSIETDTESEGEPDSKRIRRVRTRTSGPAYGLYIPPKDFYIPDEFKHTCIDEGRIVLGPEYDCPCCQWKHLLKPVKPIFSRMNLGSKHITLKKLRVEHPVEIKKFVKVRTKSALTVEGERLLICIYIQYIRIE